LIKLWPIGISKRLNRKAHNLTKQRRRDIGAVCPQRAIGRKYQPIFKKERKKLPNYSYHIDKNLGNF
jgi:hypothetical protein